jgi:integrase
LARKRLTATALKTLKAPPPHPSGKRNGKRFVMDAEVRGLGIKVSETGTKSWVVLTRFPGSDNPTARKLAPFEALDLAEAREQARKWLKDIAQGIDPAEHERKAKVAAARKRENSFASVFEDFARDKLATERQGANVARDMRKFFLAAWSKQPVSEIAAEDVLSIVRTAKQRSPSHARLLLGYCRRFFDWAIEQHAYEIKTNPCLGLKPTRLLGEKVSRARVLSDEELFAFTRTIERMSYPYKQLYQLLLLSGVRLNECADARWHEIDMRSGSWVIPGARMKTGADHVVPITPQIRAVLDSLPRFKTGDYLFSAKFGQSPIWVSARVKKEIDARMLRTLRALARRRGDDPTQVVLQPWVNHDLRRSLRTNLSKLRIDRDIREACLAHTRGGGEGTYDRHDFFLEKMGALEKWAGYLQNLAEPASPTNVVKLHA